MSVTCCHGTRRTSPDGDYFFFLPPPRACACSFALPSDQDKPFADCRLFSNYRKGVSFLSRIIGGKKKAQLSDAEDDVSEADTGRMDADAAAQPIGFIPRFPRPPKYLRVRAHFKKEKTFNRVFVAQELESADELSASPKKGASSSTAGLQSGHINTGKALWSVVFSNDGKYLAAAGQDRKVRIWAVISSSSDRDAAGIEGEDQNDDDEFPKLKAPVFRSKPIQVFEGHTGSILDLSWSKVCFSPLCPSHWFVLTGRD